MRVLIPARRRSRDERGDTLIEVLFAVVIIALAAGPLIGALLESIAASAEHRGLATADTLLQTFAETAVSEIQTSPLPGTHYTASTVPSYRLISNPSKASGPGTTTVVTVFVTGFNPATGPLSVTVGTHPATIVHVTRYGSGTADARVTFHVPNRLPPSTTPYAISVNDSTRSPAVSLPDTGFTVSSSAPSNQGVKTPYGKGYEVQVASVTCWTQPSGAFAVCSTHDKTSGLQFLTFSARGPVGSLGTLGVVVRDPTQR